MTKKDFLNSLNVGDLYLTLWYGKGNTTTSKVNGLVNVGLRKLTKQTNNELMFEESKIDVPRQSEITVLDNGFKFSFDTQDIVYLSWPKSNEYVEIDSNEKYYEDVYNAFIDTNDEFDFNKTVGVKQDTEQGTVELKYNGTLTESKRNNTQLKILREQDEGQDFNSVVNRQYSQLEEEFNEEFGGMQKWSQTYRDFTENLSQPVEQERYYFVSVIHDDRFVEPSQPHFELFIYRFYVDYSGDYNMEEYSIDDLSLIGELEDIGELQREQHGIDTSGELSPNLGEQSNSVAYTQGENALGKGKVTKDKQWPK